MFRAILLFLTFIIFCSFIPVHQKAELVEEGWNFRVGFIIAGFFKEKDIKDYLILPLPQASARYGTKFVDFGVRVGGNGLGASVKLRLLDIGNDENKFTLSLNTSGFLHLYHIFADANVGLLSSLRFNKDNLLFANLKYSYFIEYISHYSHGDPDGIDNLKGKRFFSLRLGYTYDDGRIEVSPNVIFTRKFSEKILFVPTIDFMLRF